VDDALHSSATAGQMWRTIQSYRDITQNGQQDVDEEISIASTLKENTKGR
jgi:hypothetical protein